jgi:hypothetical protein
MIPKRNVQKRKRKKEKKERKKKRKEKAVSLNSGVDVMITIFCDFCQFLAKKLAFSKKTNVMIKIFA